MRKLLSGAYNYQTMNISQKSNITYFFAAMLVVGIHFYLYNQFWFMRLLGWNIYDGKKNLIFLLLLFSFALICQLTMKSGTEKRIPNISRQMTPWLCFYFASGIFTAIIHEQNFGVIKTYLFYLFTPVMVSLSIFAIFKDNKIIKKTLFILFLSGIILSLYSTVLHIKMMINPLDYYYAISSDVQNAANMTRESLTRYSIPGLGANNFESMLVPLVLIGFYYIKNNNMIIKCCSILAASFLFYNMAISGSRGALFSLVCGVVYLCFKKFFNSDRPSFLILMLIFLVIIIMTKVLMLRSLLTIQQFLPSIGNNDLIGSLIQTGQHGYGMAYNGPREERFVLLLNTLQVIKGHPLFGVGYSNFHAYQEKIFSGAADHDAFLSIFAQGGLILLIPLVSLVFLTYFNSNKSQKLHADPLSRDLGILLTAILLSYIADQFFTPGFFHRHWLWFGFAAAWARNCEMEYQAPAKVSGA